MRKIVKTIHLWLSLVFGVVFFMSCITGAMLVFEDEITDLYYNDVRHIPTGNKTFSESEMREMLAANPEFTGNIKSIKASASADVAYKVTLSKPKGDAYYVNQYTGEIVAPCGRLVFFTNVQKLHRWIMCLVLK